MNTSACLILMLSLTISATYPIKAQERTTGKSLKEGLFQLNEIDLHVHAGKERPLPLNEWIDLFARDGRKVILLLDHLELYRMDDKEHKEWIKENNFNDWYPKTTTGKYDFIKEMSTVESRNDVLTFRGWEIWEGEFEEGLEKPPMKEAEVIGWHMSKAAWNGKAPVGKELIFRARQIVGIQKEFPVPMIIFHPFIGRIKAVREAAAKSGRNLSSIKKEEYRYFTPTEQKELIEILNGSSIYIEISRGWSTLWSDPVVREAFIEDIRPLAEGGVKFTVSTDAHGTSSFDESYNPELYCKDLRITPEDVNTIIRELLAIRAKRNLR
ncbi:MAG: hypothetical protein D4R64_04615 [Porphyromonadaceae bacterium]|nr:MAG: hypothetical protein D4R64_04615 [Porphyromonadaceae bacterium]